MNAVIHTLCWYLERRRFGDERRICAFSNMTNSGMGYDCFYFALLLQCSYDYDGTALPAPAGGRGGLAHCGADGGICRSRG